MKNYVLTNKFLNHYIYLFNLYFFVYDSSLINFLLIAIFLVPNILFLIKNESNFNYEDHQSLVSIFNIIECYGYLYTVYLIQFFLLYPFEIVTMSLKFIFYLLLVSKYLILERIVKK